MLDNEKIQSVLAKADALAANTVEGFALAVIAAYAAGLEVGKACGKSAE
jgi:glycosyltransferase involved in cell wall biosynthesis